MEREKIKAQRLADRCDGLAQIADAYDPEAYRQAAALLLHQEELLEQALEALEEAHDQSLDGMHFECRQTLMAQISAIRTHREAK